MHNFHSLPNVSCPCSKLSPLPLSCYLLKTKYFGSSLSPLLFSAWADWLYDFWILIINTTDMFANKKRERERILSDLSVQTRWTTSQSQRMSFVLKQQEINNIAVYWREDRGSPVGGKSLHVKLKPWGFFSYWLNLFACFSQRPKYEYFVYLVSL